MKAAKKAPLKKREAKVKGNDLGALLADVARSGGVTLVDLTQTLSADFPTIVLPPEMGQSRPFRAEEISRHNELHKFADLHAYRAVHHAGRLSAFKAAQGFLPG